MIVTSFRIRRIENPTNRLIAKCTLTFDNTLAVSDIKILAKDEGEFYMGMPSRKTTADTFKDVAYPVNAQARAALEGILFGAVKYCLDNDVYSLGGTSEEKDDLTKQCFEDFSVEIL